MDWKLTAITEHCTLVQALEKINSDGCQIALVIDSEERLKGIINDSDIRKGLLKGVKLEDKAEDVMNSNPIVVGREIDSKNASILMKVNKIFQLPVVDDLGRVIGLHLAEELKKKVNRPERIIIMAGGKGKRLLPLTENVPKPMLPIGDKPILEHILLKIREEGFENVTISINYLGEIIRRYFGDGNHLGLKINYLEEDTNKPLGTAGVLSKITNLIDEEIIMVTNGDVITDTKFKDMLDYAYKNKCDGLMAVKTEEWQNPFAVVKSKGMRMTSLVEKPIYKEQVNAGIYCIKKCMVDLIDYGQYYDMPDLFLKAIENNFTTNIYPLHEYWLDIGRPEDYRRARNI